MATQGSTATAVSRGGSGTVSTPADNVGGDSATNRRVCPPFPFLPSLALGTFLPLFQALLLTCCLHTVLRIRHPLLRSREPEAFEW